MLKRKRLATVYSGSAPENRVLSEEKYRRWFDAVIYLVDLPDTDLSNYDGLIIPEGLHHRRQLAASGQILEFLESGGTVFLFGDQPAVWLPGLNWEFQEAAVLGSGDLVVHHPEHSFHRHLKLDDFHHCHGVFHPPEGARMLVTKASGGAVVYIDRVSTPGTIMVSSLDLMRHVGGSWANTSARFLERFLPWATEEFI